MAKRFIDTDLFKKRFVRGLKGPYKLLWVYLFCECDNAGIWNVDIEAAELFCNQKYSLPELKKAFSGRIHFFDEESKAFLPDFIEFQYGGELNEKNPAHRAVIFKLEKYQLFSILKEGATKAQESPYEGATEEPGEAPERKPEGEPNTEPEEEPKKGKNFKKPTVEEVRAYCEERNNGIDPQGWIDHYTANGWKVGKNPMKDWKAAVRTWERNGINNNSNGRKGQTTTGATTCGLGALPGDTTKKTYKGTL